MILLGRFSGLDKAWLISVGYFMYLWSVSEMAGLANLRWCRRDHSSPFDLSLISKEVSCAYSHGSSDEECEKHQERTNSAAHMVFKPVLCHVCKHLLSKANHKTRPKVSVERPSELFGKWV